MERADRPGALSSAPCHLRPLQKQQRPHQRPLLSVRPTASASSGGLTAARLQGAATAAAAASAAATAAAAAVS